MLGYINRFCSKKFCRDIPGKSNPCKSDSDKLENLIKPSSINSYCPTTRLYTDGIFGDHWTQWNPYGDYCADGYAVLANQLDCMSKKVEEWCRHLRKTQDTSNSLCELCNTGRDESLRCTRTRTPAPTLAPTTAAPRAIAPVIGKVTGAPTTAAPRATAPAIGKVTGAPTHTANIYATNSTLVMTVAETPNILAYSLGAAGAAAAVTAAAYPVTCWIVDGLVLRKKDWIKSPQIRGQQLLAWCRGKNKAEESSIEMSSNSDEKVELEGDSFLSEGDKNTSAKKKKGWAWSPLTRVQQLYGWCRGKNKAVESSIEVISSDDNKEELEVESFLSEADENTSAKKQKGWAWSPLTRVQQLYGWCRGKNKAEESSIEMASSEDNKAEPEGNSFLSEGDENASAKKKKGWVWAPITGAQKFYGWFRGKNKPVESSIDMDSNGDEKVEEDNSFLNEGVKHVRAKKKKGKFLLQSYPFYSSSKC